MHRWVYIGGVGVAVLVGLKLFAVIGGAVSMLIHLGLACFLIISVIGLFRSRRT